MTDLIVLMYGDEDFVRELKESSATYGIETGDGWLTRLIKTEARTRTLKRWIKEDSE